MSESFDPYYKWLGIAPKDQPPSHYRLLGLDPFEPDPEVIEAAANRQMIYIQGCASGPHVALSQRLLNEIAQARLALLDPARKVTYDRQLRSKPGTAGDAVAAVQGSNQAVGVQPGFPPVQPVGTVFGGVPYVVPGTALPQGVQPVPVAQPIAQPVPMPGGPSAGYDVRSRRSVRGAARGRTRIRFDWRFPAFILVVIGLIAGGVIIARKLHKLIEEQSASTPGASAPVDTEAEPRVP